MTEDEGKGNNLKLKSFLSLVRNKKNQQYSFVLKKRMFTAFNITPSNILDMKLPIKQKRKTIKKLKFSK